MTDMLVKLYTLPELAPVLVQQRAQDIDIRRALVLLRISSGWSHGQRSRGRGVFEELSNYPSAVGRFPRSPGVRVGVWVVAR